MLGGTFLPEVRREGGSYLKSVWFKGFSEGPNKVWLEFMMAGDRQNVMRESEGI